MHITCCWTDGKTQVRSCFPDERLQGFQLLRGFLPGVRLVLGSAGAAQGFCSPPALNLQLVHFTGLNRPVTTYAHEHVSRLVVAYTPSEPAAMHVRQLREVVRRLDLIKVLTPALWNISCFNSREIFPTITIPFDL